MLDHDHLGYMAPFGRITLPAGERPTMSLYLEQLPILSSFILSKKPRKRLDRAQEQESHLTSFLFHTIRITHFGNFFDGRQIKIKMTKEQSYVLLIKLLIINTVKFIQTFNRTFVLIRTYPYLLFKIYIINVYFIRKSWQYS